MTWFLTFLGVLAAWFVASILVGILVGRLLAGQSDNEVQW